MNTFKTFIVLLFCVFVSVEVQSQDTLTQVQINGPLQVKGTKIIGVNHGNPVQLRGMSMFWSQWSEGSRFYKAKVVNKLVSDWKANVIRATMGIDAGGSGYKYDPEIEKEKVMIVVDAAIAKGIYVIIDWHSHDALNEKALAKSFFAEMAQKYGSYPNVIYEPFNEPLDISWSTKIKPYCQEIIDTIRKHDTDNLVICGTRNWSQRVDEVATDMIKDTNVAYALHYYAATHTNSLRNTAQTAINKGVPIFVTEFGTCEASGNGKIDFAESNKWWDFLEANDISWCNWSVSDKSESASALVLGVNSNGNWNLSDYSISGAFVRNKLRYNYNYPKYTNNLQLKLEKGYELLYTDTTYKFGLSLYNNGVLVSKDSVKYKLEVSNGGTVNDTALFSPNGEIGNFRLFVTAIYDTLRTTAHFDFILTDVKPADLLNKKDKTYLVLTKNGEYKLNPTITFPSPIATTVPKLNDTVSISTEKYVWQIQNEHTGVFSTSNEQVKTYLAIYVTNPVERTGKIAINSLGSSTVYFNGISKSNNTYNFLAGENLILIEYLGATTGSNFDFTILTQSGDTMPYLTYSTTGSGTFDCNKTWKGTAFIDPACGCLGGTTGIAHCPGAFNTLPAPIPGNIQAVEYDYGKAGVTFLDMTSGNAGNSDLRKPDDVDVYTSADGKSKASVGYIETGEWLKYSVDVTLDTAYVADFRIATAYDLNKMQLKIDGVNLFSKDFEVPSTGDWSIWKTFTSDTFKLKKGLHILTFEAKGGYFGLNYINFRNVIVSGIQEEETVNAFVAPNPFVSALQLKTIKPTEYSFYNLQGEAIEKGKCANDCLVGQSLPKGVFILELIQDNKRLNKKIIKSN